MSASAILTGAVLVLVAFILWREHRKQKTLASNTRPAPRRELLNDPQASAWLKALPDMLEPHRLPVVRITPLAAPPSTPWQSRFGGKAYWPKNTPWPTTPQGKPLYLLAQLNLDEMPALPGYPDSGMLQFFIANDDLMGLRFPSAGQDPLAIATDPLGFRVVFHPQVITDEQQLDAQTPVADDDAYLPLQGSYSLHFAADTALPAPTDHRFSGLIEGADNLPDDAHDLLYETYSAEGCHLGGYATFTQDDPRYGTEPGDWLLLFQMDTSYGEDGVDIMWGDSGVGNFFIHKDDLARRDFSRVWYNWDCC